MDESRLLAQHIVDIGYDDIPADVIEVAKKSLLDGLGVMICATSLGEGCREFISLAEEGGGKAESSIIGSDKKVPSYMAAFANGSLAHAIDFEDTYFIHPNAATIPAALATAESLGNISGKEFLTAMTLGSDLVCRLSRSLIQRSNSIEYGWYIPPILNVYGAVTSASKLMGLDTGQLMDAISLAMCQVTCSAELINSPRSLVRGVRDAFSTKAGVMAAILAQKGIIGFDRPFEGKGGFFTMYARGSYDRELLIEDLGKTFLNGQVSFKPWPSCAGTHPYIEATLQLAEKYDLKPQNIEAVTFQLLSPNTMLCEPLESKRKPVKAIDAKFSIPFTIATALVRRHVVLDDFLPDALKRDDVLEVSQKVSYEQDNIEPDDNAVPQGLVTIKTKNGKIDSEAVKFIYGNPNNPMSRDAIIDKFMNCASYYLKKIPEEKLNRIVQLVFDLESAKDVGEIMELI